MSSFIKVNVSALSSCQGEFSDEQSYFNNNTYTTFSNGYICSCGDQYISQMASHMLTCYDTLKAGYTNINDWWTSYVSDVETLENVLSGQSDLGEITSPELIAALGKLYNTDDYDNTLEGEYTGEEDPSIFGIDDQSTIDAAYNQGEVEGKENALVGLTKEYLTKVTDSCVDIYNEDGTINVMNVIKNIGTIRLNMIKITTATQTTGCLGLAEGVLKFVESLADAGVSLVTIGATGLQTLNGILNGTDYKKANEELWEQTKSFIAKDHVTSLFNKFYETEAGSVIKNNTLAFDTVRGITKGIGNTIGVVGLATVTGGSSLAIGGLAGYGRAAEEAYASGAGTWEGQGYAALKGLWEAGQFALSGATKGLTMDNRIMLDGFSGAAEAIVDPYAKAIYQKGTYNENGNYNAFTADDSYVDRVNKIFEANGGWKNVLIQGASSSATSAISEAFDYLKDGKKNKPDVIDADISKTKGSDLTDKGETLSVDSPKSASEIVGETGDTTVLHAMDNPNPVSAVAGEVGDTSPLHALDDADLPKTKGNGLTETVETLGMDSSNPISTVAGKVGDTTVLHAMDDADFPKTKGNGLTETVETLSMDSPNPVESIALLNHSDGIESPKRTMLVEPVLYTPSQDSSSPTYLKNLFEETADEDYGIGNDQGRYKRYYYYTDSNGQSISPGSQAYKDAIKSGRKLVYTEANYDVLDTCNMLVRKYNMSYQDAIRTVELIDVDAGVCSYSATLDNLVALYVDRQQEFYDKTGIPLFVKGNSKSGAIMNTTELLADLYVTANLDTNGGKYFTLTPDGKVTFTNNITVDNFGNAFGVSDVSQQVYLSTGNGKNIASINAYLKNNGLTDKFNAAHYQNYGWTRDTQTGTVDVVLRDINQQIQTIDYMCTGIMNGKQYELGIMRSKKALRFLNPNTGEVLTTTHAWNEGGGHATKVIGYNSKGFIISTWGKELVVPYGDLLETTWDADEVSLN